MQVSLDKKDELRCSIEATLGESLEQERQLRLQSEIELSQERLLREKSQESLEQASQQVNMLQEELHDKVEQFLSMKTSFE